MKTMLITGANRGIGLEVARQLARRGYFIYLGSREAQQGQAAVQQLQDEGLSGVVPIALDISNPASVMAARQELGEKIDQLDGLINNAGISGGFPQPTLTTSLETIREVFETNFFGTINVTQAFLDLLQRSAAPRIVNVTSGLASLTLHNDPNWRFHYSKTAAYGPSKTALNAYTVALAHALKETPFKVNAVDPGFTATDFNNYRGTSDVPTAAGHVVRLAVIGADGPTGQYFSWDNNPETGVSPW